MKLTSLKTFVALETRLLLLLLSGVFLLASCKRDSLSASGTTQHSTAVADSAAADVEKEASVVASVSASGQKAAVEKAFSGPLSSNGKVFTPKGEIRFLIIFAGFNSAEGRAPMDLWSADSTHILNIFDAERGGDPASMFYSDNKQFGVVGQPANKSISNYLYEMSGGKLKVTADVFKNPLTGKAERINISPQNLRNWEQANRRVLEQIKERFDGKFNWGRYDQRTNYPNYRFDNSASGPDGEPDYVIIVYRNNNKIGSLPTNFHASSRLSGAGDLKIRGTGNKMYSFGKGAGFTYAKGFYFEPSLFIHELAHELFDCPHYFAANYVTWNRFFLSNGIGMMKHGELTSSCNAWEAWYLGWLNLKPSYDITPARVPQKPIVVRDYLTYREPIRVAIPHTNPVQHLWIENRQRVHLFDERSTYHKDNLGNIIPEPPAGLYLYVEDMAPTRENPEPLVYKRNNSMRLLHAAGNYDYTVQKIAAEERIWCNLVGELSPLQVTNPMSGTNDISVVPGDYTTYKKVPNCSAEFLAGPNNIIEYNSSNMNTGKLEHVTVLKKGANFTYGWWGAYDPKVPGSTSVAFNQVGQGAGLSYNPPILPLQEYHSSSPNPGLSPIYLNGLSVKIVGKRADTGGKKAGEEYLVEVRYNNVDISVNQRFTGNIVQQKVPDTPHGYDINLKKGITLTIDKSGTANRHLPTPSKEFINPTSYTVEEGSISHQERNSAVVVTNGSTFTVRNGASVVLEEGASFDVKAGSSLVVEPEAKFSLGAAGVLTIHHGAVRLDKNSHGLFLEKNSKVRVQENGQLVLAGNLKAAPGGSVELMVERGGVLELRNAQAVNYRITIRPGGRLVIPAVANISLSSYGKINVEKGGKICLHPSAKVTGANAKNLAYNSDSLIKGGCL